MSEQNPMRPYYDQPCKISFELISDWESAELLLIKLNVNMLLKRPHVVRISELRGNRIMFGLHYFEIYRKALIETDSTSLCLKYLVSNQTQTHKSTKTGE